MAATTRPAAHSQHLAHLLELLLQVGVAATCRGVARQLMVLLQLRHLLLQLGRLPLGSLPRLVGLLAVVPQLRHLQPAQWRYVSPC